MTEAPQQTLALRTLTDLVEIVPSLLGFHPDCSLVLLAIEDGVLAVTARVDLDEVGRHATAAAMAPLLEQHPDATFVGLAFCEHPERAWWVLDDVDAALPSTAPRMLAHVDGERWYDHPADEGTPYDAWGSVHLAEAAWAGRPVRRSRAELARLLEPTRTPAEVTASLERVAARGERLGEVLAEARALVAGHDDAPGELDLDEATVLCLASHDDDFLDEALLSTTADNADSRVALWAQVVGSSVPNCAGGGLVAVGVASWVGGGGALTSLCLEALDGRPGPAHWVAFLEMVNRHAISPKRWEELREAMAAAEAGALVS
ncbi:MAG: DUF4192 domain-containing protein [Propionibacteriaceae bacterium]|nr:DUF4192 domain-containing protein [Propionibacteriaceae bacterium]